jgi:hypothetical protein
VLDCLVYGIASAVVFFPFALSYLAVALLEAFLDDIIRFPSTYYAEMRRLPFPGPGDWRTRFEDIPVYFPVLVLLVAAWSMRSKAATSQQAAEQSDQFPLIVMMAVLSAILFYKGVVRVSTLHMMMSIIPATVLSGAILDRIMSNRGPRQTAAALILIALLPALVAAKRLASDVLNPTQTVLGWAITAQPPADDCASVDAQAMLAIGKDYRAVADYLRQHADRGSKILVGLGRHDKIFVNPQILYFEAGLLPGTHWHHFDPGLQTRADIQRDMIADMQRQDVAWVVRDASFDAIREPNGSARSSGVFLLDRYLEREYRMVEQSGDVSIWLRREMPAPKGPAGGLKRACLPDRPAMAAD